MKQARKALLRGVLGLGLLAGVVALADVSQLQQLLAQAKPAWLLLGLAAALLSNLISAWRWSALARWLGCEVQTPQAVRWYFQGMGLNALLPGAVVGGDVYRAMALKRDGQPTAAAAWSVLLDRLSGVWMLCALGALGAFFMAEPLAQWLGWPVQLLQALAGLALGAGLLLPWALPWLVRCLPQGGWSLPLRAVMAHPDYRRQMAWQALVSTGVQVFSAAALACGGVALGLDLPPPAWAFAMAPVFLMAALPVSVGGWGTREAAAVIALSPFGAPAAAAVGTAIIYGGYGIVQALLGALAFGMPGQTRQS